jgi:cation diffusion facilitator CzcD-associated flavoprotein CzcO
MATKKFCARSSCIFCTGYYDYRQAHRPTFEGEHDFRGRIVHPQFWPMDLDYHGLRIVIVGSGATAVTLGPAMAGTAAHVTTLQRSPSFVANQPSIDAWARTLERFLPAAIVYPLVRWKRILTSAFFYKIARRRPRVFRRRLLELAAQELPPDFDVHKHFSPSYEPGTSVYAPFRTATFSKKLRQVGCRWSPIESNASRVMAFGCARVKRYRPTGSCSRRD